jgi:SAM-dependent methyltransferase
VTDNVTEKMTFAFGQNWLNYLNTVEEAELAAARASLTNLLQVQELNGKRFLDIGCGSGLFSAAALALGAASVTSVDVDPNSVAATQKLKARLPVTQSWQVLHGSVLDGAFLQQLAPADVVYSWGVLHHTGNMWPAIENATTLVADGGLLAIAIYNRTWSSGFWWRFKRLYNQSNPAMQRFLVWYVFGPRAVVRLLKGKSPVKGDRGMSIYYDAVDWAGGFPYEYATFEEIVNFCGKFGFRLTNAIPTKATGCNQFVFQKQ